MKANFENRHGSRSLSLWSAGLQSTWCTGLVLACSREWCAGLVLACSEVGVPAWFWPAVESCVSLHADTCSVPAELVTHSSGTSRPQRIEMGSFHKRSRACLHTWRKSQHCFSRVAVPVLSHLSSNQSTENNRSLGLFRILSRAFCKLVVFAFAILSCASVLGWRLPFHFVSMLRSETAVQACSCLHRSETKRNRSWGCFRTRSGAFSPIFRMS